MSCPAGTYSNSEGATSSSACLTCPRGSRLQTVDGKGVCTPCPVGTYEDDGRCYTCLPGTISAEEGNTKCTPCEPGTISKNYGNGYTECVPCPATTYEEDRTKCLTCVSGYYSNQVGGSGPSTCKKCADGYVTRNGGGNTHCTACPAGTAADMIMNSCLNCAPGTYAPGEGQTRCQRCPPGTRTLSFGGPNKECVPCPENTYEEDNMKCMNCFGGHSMPGSTSCISNFAPDSFAGKIQQNLAQINITNTRDFLLGTGYSLYVEDDINKLQSLAEVPEQLENTFNLWANVDWRNGSSLGAAIQSTAESGMTLYDHLPGPLRLELQVFVAGVAGPLVIGYKAGAYIYNFENKMMDVTTHVKELYNGFEQKDYYKAGHAFGDLIKDGIDLKDMKKELDNNTS